MLKNNLCKTIAHFLHIHTLLRSAKEHLFKRTVKSEKIEEKRLSIRLKIRQFSQNERSKASDFLDGTVALTLR